MPTPSNAPRLPSIICGRGEIGEAFRELLQMKEFWMDLLSARASQLPQPSPFSTEILSLNLPARVETALALSSRSGRAKSHAEPRRHGSILRDLQLRGALLCVFACVFSGCMCKLRTGIGLCHQSVESLAVQAVCHWAGSSCGTRRDWCYCHNHVRTCTRT